MMRKEQRKRSETMLMILAFGILTVKETTITQPSSLEQISEKVLEVNHLLPEDLFWEERIECKTKVYIVKLHLRQIYTLNEGFFVMFLEQKTQVTSGQDVMKLILCNEDYEIKNEITLDIKYKVAGLGIYYSEKGIGAKLFDFAGPPLGDEIYPLWVTYNGKSRLYKLGYQNDNILIVFNSKGELIIESELEKRAK